MYTVVAVYTEDSDVAVLRRVFHTEDEVLSAIVEDLVENYGQGALRNSREQAEKLLAEAEKEELTHGFALHVDYDLEYIVTRMEA